jgi:hypothetical protein
MLSDGVLVAVALGVLGLGMLYAFAGSSISYQWHGWIVKAGLAAGAAFGIGMATLGLPGMLLVATFIHLEALSPDGVWPLAITVTVFGSLAIFPASLLLRLVMPDTVGWAHAGATALLTFVVSFVFMFLMVGSYLPA